MQNNECSYICEQFTEYQDQTLSMKIRSHVDAHLAICSSCQSRFQELDIILDRLHQLSPIMASPDFTEKLMHKAHQQSTESVWERFYQSPYSRIAGFAVAAGLVAAIGLNIWIEPIGPGSSNSNFTEKKINPTAVYANRPDSIGLGNDSLQLQPGKINSDGSVLKLVSDKK